MYCTGEAKGRDAPSVALLRIIISLASSERCSDGWDARGKKKGMRQRASCLATPANDARFSILPRSPHHSRALLPIEEKKKSPSSSPIAAIAWSRPARLLHHSAETPCSERVSHAAAMGVRSDDVAAAASPSLVSEPQRLFAFVAVLFASTEQERRSAGCR